jgi:hypothetical protein
MMPLNTLKDKEICLTVKESFYGTFGLALLGMLAVVIIITFFSVLNLLLKLTLLLFFFGGPKYYVC